MNSQSWKMTWRWALCASALTALFWGVWYFINGSVPVTDKILIAPNQFFVLPFSISRWWDIAAIAIFAAVATQLRALYIRTENSDVKDVLAAVLVVGLFGGLIGWLTFGLVVDLVVELVVGLITGLIFFIFFINKAVLRAFLSERLNVWFMGR